jgi:hypothetical protein
MKSELVCVLALVLSVGTGCSHAAKPMPGISLSQFAAGDSGKNELVFFQSRLVIPDDWWFQRRNPDEASESNGVQTAQLFQFGDTVGNVSGSFYYTAIPDMQGAISADSLMKVYTKKVIRNVKHKQAHPTSIDGENSYVITGIKEPQGWDYMGALVPEKNAFNLIMLLSDPGTLTNHPEIGFRVFASYSYEKAGVARRAGPGMIRFECNDDSWHWLDDWHTGPIEGYFLLDNEKSDTPISSIGVARLKVATLDQLRPQFTEFKETVTGAEFDVTLPIGSATLTGRGIATRAENGLISAYYLLPSGGANYLVMVCHDQGAVEREPTALHEWPTFTDVLTKYLSL